MAPKYTQNFPLKFFNLIDEILLNLDGFLSVLCLQTSCTVTSKISIEPSGSPCLYQLHETSRVLHPIPVIFS